MFFIFWYDYLLLPFYLIAVFMLMNVYFNRKYGYNSEVKKYFDWGFRLKVVGCIAIGMIYEYYYLGSFDGRFYFDGGKVLASYWLEYPSQFFPVLFNDLNYFNENNLKGVHLSNVFIVSDTAFFVSKIAGIFNIFSFNAFLPCTLLICAVAFIGIWNLFEFFVREQGLSLKVASFCSIYIPSLLVWDSSLFKDTITFTALCWAFICGYYTFIKPRKLIVNVIGLSISVFLITEIKVYIIAAFAPFFILYVFNSYKSSIENPTLRILATPFILLLSVISIALFLQNANELLGNYSLDQVLETASMTAFHIGELNAGSAYSIDADLSSIGGLLKAIPAGINVTLFRPYPWEYFKPIILFASVESMVFLYFTIKVIRKLGVKKFFQTIWKNPLLQFCLLFTLLFAFMVGISSANFGTLVRYKIPCLPFYALFIAVLYKEGFVKPEADYEPT